MKQLLTTFLIGFLTISLTAQIPITKMQNLDFMNEDARIERLDKLLDKTHKEGIKDTFQNYSRAELQQGISETMSLINELFKKTLSNNAQEEASSLLLDSIISYAYSSEMDSVFSGKAEYSYDASGNQTLRISYNWDSSINDWVPSTKSEYSYDASGNQTLKDYYDWDSSINDWVGYLKEEFSFDINGNETLYYYYYWDGSVNDWVPRGKEEFSFDVNDNEILHYYYDWDGSVNDWVGNDKYEYSYDANGNLILYLGYQWDSSINDWVIYSKSEYSYENNGNRTLQIYYDWDSSINDWVIYSKREYSYDANGNQTLSAYYRWDASINEWVGGTKREYNYDTSGNQILYAIYGWDASINDWVGHFKNESSYDANGYRTLFVYYLWDYDINWAPYWKSEYSYDAIGYRTSEIKYYWNTSLSDWLLSKKGFFYYSSFNQLVETDILSYSFGIPPQTGNAVIDADNHMVDIEHEYGTNLTELVATFDLSYGATAKVGGVAQESGVTVNDFTDPVIYVVTAEDGETVQDWVVRLSLAVGIGEHLVQDIRIYPNPFSKRTTIEFSNPDHSEYKLSVFTLSGKKVFEMDDITTGRVEFEKGNLSKGIYFVELKGDKVFKTKALIIE